MMVKGRGKCCLPSQAPRRVCDTHFAIGRSHAYQQVIHNHNRSGCLLPGPGHALPALKRLSCEQGSTDGGPLGTEASCGPFPFCRCSEHSPCAQPWPLWLQTQQPTFSGVPCTAPKQSDSNLSLSMCPERPRPKQVSKLIHVQSCG